MTEQISLSPLARIAELEAEIARLREALEPFADHAINFDAGECDDHPNGCPDNYPATFSSIYLTVGDFRRARAAMIDAALAGRG